MLVYEDFELLIEKTGDRFVARVLRSPAGETWREFSLPFSPDRMELLITRLSGLTRTLRTRGIFSREMESARELGSKLFDAIFDDEVRVVFQNSLNHVLEQEGKGLRLKLHLQHAGELSNVPWEFLLDTGRKRFLTQSTHTPIVRYLELPEKIRPFVVSPPLRVLVMISNPSGLESLNVERERQFLDQALSPLSREGLVEIVYLKKATLGDLQEALQDRSYHVFHFIGHGGFDEKMGAVLMLEDKDRRPLLMEPERLSTILQDHRSLRLVILNSCVGARTSRDDPFSSAAAVLVRQASIPAVVAMQFEITDTAALVFASSFYSSIAKSFPVDAALAEARKSIYAMPNDVEWATPVLFMRVPDGVLFKPAKQLDLETPAREGEASEEKAPTQPAIPRKNREKEIISRLFYIFLGVLLFQVLACGLCLLLPSLPFIKSTATPTFRGPTARFSQTAEATTQPIETLQTPVINLLPAETEFTPSHKKISITNAGKVNPFAVWGDGTINQVAVSPDGSLLAVASSIGIYLYDARSLEQLRYLKTQSWVYSAVFSPDGQILATGSADNALRLWRVADGQLLRTLPGHSRAVVSVVFSADGQSMASGSWDNTVRLWRVADGQLLRTFKGQPSIVRSVAYSPDGQTIASGSDDKTVRLWRVADGQLLHSLEGHTSLVRSVVFSPDGKTLASSSDDKTIQLWRVSDGQFLRSFKEHTGFVYSVAFSPDGKTMASGSADNSVRLWRVSDGQLLYTIEGYTNLVLVLSITFSPDGLTLFSGSWDGSLRAWRVADGQLLGELEGRTGTVFSVSLSPDGQTLATGSADNTIRLWNVSDGKLLDTLEGHTKAVVDVVFSPGGEFLASGSWDNTVRLWRVADGHLLQTLEGHTNSVYCVAFSLDGQTLASGSADNSVRLWRAMDGQPLRTLEEHTGTVYSLVFAPDGQTLVSGSADSSIRFWRVSDGQSIRTLEDHTLPVRSVAFTPDGQTLASGSDDKTIRLWRVADGQLLQTLEVHTGTVQSVAFSPDGQTLASGSADTTLRLWRTADGQNLRILDEHTSIVYRVAFSSDGQTLASGSGDGTIRLWGVQP